MNVSQDIHIEIRHAGDFVIEVNAEVDGDRVPDNICCFWTNPWTKRWRRIADRNPRVDAYIRKHFDKEINEAIVTAPIEFDDAAYDAWKEDF